LRLLTYVNRYALCLGILLAAVVISPGPGATRAGAALHDVAHAPVFACVTLLLLSLFNRAGKRASRSLLVEYATACAVACLLGLLTEILQKILGRDASWLDLKSDMIGAVAGCGVFAAFDLRVSALSRRVAAGVAGIVLLAVHSVQFGHVALAYMHRNDEFPILFDGRVARADSFVTAGNSDAQYKMLPDPFATSPGEQALRVHFSNAPWPGVSFDEVYPDWSAHKTLHLDLINPGETPLPLVVRVHDCEHNWDYGDRFNRSVTLAPRSRHVYSIQLTEIEQAPANRSLDLTQLAGLRLFTRDAYVGRDLFVSRIWLD
jgi:hypothetical protein